MKKRLALKKVTLQDLDEGSLRTVAGGTPGFTYADETCFTQHTCNVPTQCYQCSANDQCGNTWGCYTTDSSTCQSNCYC